MGVEGNKKIQISFGNDKHIASNNFKETKSEDFKNSSARKYVLAQSIFKKFANGDGVLDKNELNKMQEMIFSYSHDGTLGKKEARQFIEKELGMGGLYYEREDLYEVLFDMTLSSKVDEKDLSPKDTADKTDKPVKQEEIIFDDSRGPKDKLFDLPKEAFVTPMAPNSNKTTEMQEVVADVQPGQEKPPVTPKDEQTTEVEENVENVPEDEESPVTQKDGQTSEVEENVENVPEDEESPVTPKDGQTSEVQDNIEDVLPKQDNVIRENKHGPKEKLFDVPQNDTGASGTSGHRPALRKGNGAKVSSNSGAANKTPAKTQAKPTNNNGHVSNDAPSKAPSAKTPTKKAKNTTVNRGSAKGTNTKKSQTPASARSANTKRKSQKAGSAKQTPSKVSKAKNQQPAKSAPAKTSNVQNPQPTRTVTNTRSANNSSQFVASKNKSKGLFISERQVTDKKTNRTYTEVTYKNATGKPQKIEYRDNKNKNKVYRTFNYEYDLAGNKLKCDTCNEYNIRIQTTSFNASGKDSITFYDNYGISPKRVEYFNSKGNVIRETVYKGGVPDTTSTYQYNEFNKISREKLYKHVGNKTVFTLYVDTFYNTNGTRKVAEEFRNPNGKLVSRVNYKHYNGYYSVTTINYAKTGAIESQKVEYFYNDGKKITGSLKNLPVETHYEPKNPRRHPSDSANRRTISTDQNN